MNNIDWGMVSAIVGIGALIIAYLQYRDSKNTQEKSKQNNQVVKGLFISNNKIEQKNK